MQSDYADLSHSFALIAQLSSNLRSTQTFLGKTVANANVNNQKCAEQKLMQDESNLSPLSSGYCFLTNSLELA